jgi:hypothetical protein
LNSGFCICKAGTLTFPVTPPVHFSLLILEMRFRELFTQLALNLDPPDLSLPSS